MQNIAYGFYEQVINKILNDILKELDHSLVEINKEKIDSAESSKILADYFARVLEQALNCFSDTEKALIDRVDLCNKMIKYLAKVLKEGTFTSLSKDPTFSKWILDFLIHHDAELLLAILDKKKTQATRSDRSIVPVTSLASSSLFTGAKYEPSMESEMKKEMLSCDRIDFLVSFIKWSGLRLLKPELEMFTSYGGELRVITTSYLGATDYKAVEELSKLPNTKIKISYDTKHTRLHAKTFVFWRNTGFSTAYIGSSNISHAAMTSGLEWNIKIAQHDSPDIFEKIEASFDAYWNNAEFISFDPRDDGARLKNALETEKKQDNTQQGFSFLFDVKPYYFQQEILDKLHAEREVHNSYKNLVVAATGTGKTVISAFDYLGFCKQNPGKPNKLLFVAHRKEILQQSLDCYRGILKDLNFGSLMVDGITPDSLDHLFVSIQSFNSKELVEITSPDHYDYIVIDEFHHAAAPSYQKLLEYYRPKILFGLTATPERADGKDILPYFNNRIAAEIRLYEAIDRKLLSPFHYFGVTDSVDLENVRWVGNKYDEKELENVFVFEDQVAKKRVSFIIDALDRYCASISECIGIGFCVSKRHAEFMSDMFNKAGIPSDFLTAESNDDVRDTVKKRLVDKEINFVFVVDIYNEGIDIPEINTVLFLRPTESLTVFLQQLGRGLRLSPGKDALTVLDFVGQAHKQYSFESRFKALLGKTRKTLEQEMKSGFASVPKGCSIQLERQAQEHILNNIKYSINNKRNIIRKLSEYFEVNSELNSETFFSEYYVSPQDVYGKKYTLSDLAISSGFIKVIPIDGERNKLLANALGRLSFADSRRFLEFVMKVLPQLVEIRGSSLLGLTLQERLMLTMFHYTLWGKGLDDLDGRFRTIEEAIYWAIKDEFLYQELLGLLRYQYERIDFIAKPLKNVGFETPLELYCSYTLDQLLVALGKHTEEKKAHFQEGVLYLEDKNLDVFFVTLNKSEKDYSPTTMYKDYSINEELFHWQSQSRTTVESPTGQRYINQKKLGTTTLFFVREFKNIAGLTAPYTCLGLADYVRHYGSAPISIIWKMKEPMPSVLLQKTAKM